MPLGDEHRQLAGRTTDVADGAIAREIELLGERPEVGGRDPAHRVHELLEALGLAVELGEHRRPGVLDLVLRLTGAQPFGEIAPEAIQPGVGHFEEPAHELGAVPIEEQRRLGRVAVARVGPVAIALEKAQGEQRVEEIGVGPRVEAERLLQIAAGHGPVAEGGEQPHFQGREQDFRRPEGHADFHQSCGGQFGHRSCPGGRGWSGGWGRRFAQLV